MSDYETEERVAILCEQGLSERYAMMLAKLDLNKKPKDISDYYWALLKLNVDKILAKILKFAEHKWTVHDLFSIGLKNGVYNGLLFELQPKDKIKKVGVLNFTVKREDKEVKIHKSFRSDVKPFWYYH